MEHDQITWTDLMLMLQAKQDAERTGKETFTCPLCGGTARWWRSAENGHLWCQCEDCDFSMME